MLITLLYSCAPKYSKMTKVPYQQITRCANLYSFFCGKGKKRGGFQAIHLLHHLLPNMQWQNKWQGSLQWTLLGWVHTILLHLFDGILPWSIFSPSGTRKMFERAWNMMTTTDARKHTLRLSSLIMQLTYLCCYNTNEIEWYIKSGAVPWRTSAKELMFICVSSVCV